MTRIRPEQVLTAAKQLLAETMPIDVPTPRLLPTPVTTWEPEA